MDSINSRIAEELGVRPQQVEAAVALLDEGSTVPFISRYRKEVTGSLDDTQLRHLEERLRYLRELDERRVSILASIEEQGKLTPELARDIKLAETKTRLEDLYLPYKQKRRTKGQIALEAGLGELADGLFNDPTRNPETEAARFIDAEKGVADTKAALDGAKYILMERFAEDASLLDKLRSFLKNEAILSARVIAGKEEEGAKFRDYFEHDEPLKSMPSHRALAIFRGRNEGILSSSLKVGEELPGSMHPGEMMIAERFGLQNQNRPADKWLGEVVRWTWKVKLYTHLETDLLGELRDGAETEAINVFAHNLHDLLLAAPAGPRATLGLDPGLRTGCKIAVVDATGKLLEYATVYPHVPHNKWDQTISVMAALCAKHSVELIAIGNGTASRESDKLVIDLMKKYPALKVTKVMVSEAGASVYSASELAAKEFPDLDVSIRGAVSIARRLQDPLTKLPKLTLEALAEFPIVTYVFGFTGRSKLDEAFSHRGLTPKVVFTAADADVIKTYVRLGLGVGIVAKMAVDTKLDNDLVVLDASELFESSITKIGFRRGTFLRGFMCDFIEKFAPHLTREVMAKAIACHNKQELEELFEGVELPVH